MRGFFVFTGILGLDHKKLLEYRKIPKKIALFPIMILDVMVNILDVFFPKKDGHYVLTEYQHSSRWGRKGEICTPIGLLNHMLELSSKQGIRSRCGGEG